MMADIIKIVIYSVTVGIIVLAVGALTGHNTNAVMGIALFLIAVLVTFVSVEQLQKTITKQQTQIDDLKRELEEVKGKMKE